MSLPGFSVPLVTCPYCHVASPLSQFLIKLRGNGFSKKRFKCPACGKVGERTKDNQMLRIESPTEGREMSDDEWEAAQGPDPEYESDDPDECEDSDDFDEPNEDY